MARSVIQRGNYNVMQCVFLIVTLAFVNGCSDMEIAEFSENKPVLVLEEYFDGKIKAWGIFEDRFGRIRRQFTVQIAGEFDGSILTLDENFTYSDGKTEQRIWKIKKVDRNRYEGHADDIVGVASGVSHGNALNWEYTMNLDVGFSTLQVQFDDWMFLQPDGVLLNRARVSKLGIKIGEVTLAFYKVNRIPSEQCFITSRGVQFDDEYVQAISR